MLLEELLSSKSRAKLLGLFFLNPKNRYYLRQIEALTGLPLYTVQREVARLEACRLIVKETDGNRTYYGANPRCIIYREIKSIVIKTMGLEEELRKTVKGLDIRVAFIYGSYAQNRETPESDIDLMVVGEVSSRKLHSALSKSESFSRREVNSTVFTPSEFKKKISQKDHFLDEVMRGPKIYILGSENELKRLAKGR